MSRKKKRVSVWEALNQPVVEVTDEAAKSIFLAAAVILLMVWLMPSFGGAETISNSQFSISKEAVTYQPMFGSYSDYEEVAGASTQTIVAAPQAVPNWYIAVATTSESLGGFYEETVEQPFAQAAVEILDISQPVQEMAEFYEPGVDAVWNAWLDLMADPVSY